MDKQIGFIGTGNMAKAIIGGLINSHVVQPNQVVAFNRSFAKAEALQQAYQIRAVKSAKEAVEGSDIVIICVKPNMVHAVLSELIRFLGENSIIVSIAAGVTFSMMETVVGKNRKIIRAMPNTPALVDEGMTSLTANHSVTADELNDVQIIFNSFGKSEVVSESLIHAVVGVSGSSPAYAFMFIEAMADAAVLAGMPRDQAYRFAAQSLLGSAKMVLETGMHPGTLKDMVCSPGGTTIEAVKMLEARGLRAAVIDGIGACVEKSIKMSQE